MKTVERVLCLFGHHDWHVDKEEDRFDPDHFADNHDSPNWWGIVGVGVAVLLAFVGLIGTIVIVAKPADGPHNLFLGFLVLGAVWGWVASFIYRHRKRRDAVCIRCGKKRMEFTDRQQQLKNAKLFFTSLREVEDWDDDDARQRPPKVKA